MPRFLRFPTVFYIEPTNDCNLSCIMCPRKKSRKEVGYMSFDLFRHVVDQLADRNIAQLSLHLTGEPLLHPRIVAMVRYKVCQEQRSAACEVRHQRYPVERGPGSKPR